MKGYEKLMLVSMKLKNVKPVVVFQDIYQSIQLFYIRNYSFFNHALYICESLYFNKLVFKKKKISFKHFFVIHKT